MDLSNTKLDQLGDRLRKGTSTDEDLRLLEEFRRTFSDGYNEVVRVLTDMKVEPTGRPAKSTTSIVEKLRRETIRLTQIQDIAGCRVIVADARAQDELVLALGHLLPRSTTIDRREQPSHGYRAVHVVALSHGRHIEIQIRTILQHLWAQLSEKFADVVDPSIKYGGGPTDVLELLTEYSGLVAEWEHSKIGIYEPDPMVPDVKERIRRLLEDTLVHLPRNK